MYARDFHSSDAAFYNGRVEATTKARETSFRHWCEYVAPLGLDPYLQETKFRRRQRALTGFADRVRSGFYGRKRQVGAGTVSSALSAIGTTIALAIGWNPVKVFGSKEFLPRLEVLLDGYRKDDPATKKKAPVEFDVPEYLGNLAQTKGSTEAEIAIADSCLYAFDYLLRVGEYTKKRSRNASKQTVQFRMCDVAFFKFNKYKQLRLLPHTASDKDILSADSASLKIENQKNGWKNVCVHQEWNGEPYNSGVRALGRRYVHIRRNARIQTYKTELSAFFVDGERFDVRDKDIRASLKFAATMLDYPTVKGIQITDVDTHSLRAGGATALALAGYSDTQIQKMGRWRGATFKEYIREELSCYSRGMSRNMKKKFNFVNIANGTFRDVTAAAVATDYHNAERIVAVSE